jgi:hypothetical protein
LICKPKQPKKVAKQPKSQKLAFFAFFPGKGKDDEIRAIFRGVEFRLRCFVSANKAKKQA